MRLRLKGVEEEEILNGYILCDALRPVKATNTFEAQLVILEHRNIFTAGYSAVLHVQSLVEEVNVVASTDSFAGVSRYYAS